MASLTALTVSQRSTDRLVVGVTTLEYRVAWVVGFGRVVQEAGKLLPTRC